MAVGVPPAAAAAQADPADVLRRLVGASLGRICGDKQTVEIPIHSGDYAGFTLTVSRTGGFIPAEIAPTPWPAAVTASVPSRFI